MLLLGAITALGAAFRFYGLAWGAPYYHFHIDEHFVFASADMLRRDPHEAAMSPKFFMYSPLLPYLINIARAVYEALSHPLQLNVPRDEIIYMVMGRAISAAIGTGTILVAYVIGARLSGAYIGTSLLAAAPGGIAEMSITAKVLRIGVAFVTAAHVVRYVMVVMLTIPVFHLISKVRTPRG